MAARCLFCVFAAFVVCFSKAQDLCTNQWEVTVEGSNASELVIHHSSVSAPGRLTHLVWQWRGVTGEHPPANIWVTRHTRRGDRLEGGFSLEPLAVFSPAPRLWWALEGEGNMLRLEGRGDPRPLAAYPAWQVALCEARLTLGINSDNQLYVIYGDVNVSRNLEEGWTMESRMKRQAEFPTVTEAPLNNATNTSWWRSLWEKLTKKTDGTSRSWTTDVAEMLVKLIFTTLRIFQGKPTENIPPNPDAEFIPSRFQAAQFISDDT